MKGLIPRLNYQPLCIRQGEVDLFKKPPPTPVGENYGHATIHMDALAADPASISAEPGDPCNRHLASSCKYFYIHVDSIGRIEIYPNPVLKLGEIQYGLFFCGAKS